MSHTPESPNDATADAIDHGGKYLTFALGQESYGMPVLKVREIISMLHITPVPQMPEYVKGVINLRGKVIPVVDLRVKFNLAQTAIAATTCIVVVQIGSRPGESLLMGAIVDAVEEVANLAGKDIQPAPDFGAQLDTSYILGMAKVKGTVKTLIDIDQVLAAEDLVSSEASAA